MEIRDIAFGFALVSASEDTILQSRLSDIRRFNEFHSVLLSPVRKLPDELLGEIFGHVIQGIQIGAQRSSIWDLGQVCVHWRNIVQATPLLWCSFSVWRTEVDTATMYHRIKSCLKFSRTVPMSISLFPRSFLKFPTQAFNDIADHADRLIHLSAHADVIEDMTATPSVEASIQRLRFSQLRKLVIHWQGISGTSIECALRLFRTAIALEEVDLGRIYPTNISEISWNRVKKLTWNYVSCPIHEFAAILRTMSCLEDLTWRQDAENDSLSSGEVIVLPSLRILNVCNGHFAQIWPTLRIPSLNKFQIKNDYDKDDSNIFLNLFQRSGSNIKRLDLLCCPIDSIIRFIQQLRDVEELYLWNIDADELPEIISCLGHNLSDCSTDIQFLPRLQKLGVCFSGDLDNLKVFETIREVMIARTRSFTSTASIEDHPVQHLSFVKCSITHVHPASYFAYNSELKELKGLGNKLGIEVEVDMPPAERLNEVPAAAITGGSGRGGLVEPSSGSSLF